MSLITYTYQTGEFYSSHKTIVDSLIAIGETILGGLFLTLVLFAINVFVIPKRNITGEWIVTVDTIDTSYNPFEGLKMEYKFHLLQKGYDIIGTGEKISESKADGITLLYKRKNRVRNTSEGYMDRPYIKKTKIYLKVIEQGRIRMTSATFFLTFENNNKMSGSFISTAADSKGTVTLIRSSEAS